MGSLTSKGAAMENRFDIVTRKERIFSTTDARVASISRGIVIPRSRGSFARENGHGLIVVATLFAGLIEAKFPHKDAMMMGIYATALSLGNVYALQLIPSSSSFLTVQKSTTTFA
jgi:hypothetical protein